MKRFALILGFVSLLAVGCTQQAAVDKAADDAKKAMDDASKASADATKAANDASKAAGGMQSQVRPRISRPWHGFQLM